MASCNERVRLKTCNVSVALQLVASPQQSHPEIGLLIPQVSSKMSTSDAATLALFAV